MKRFRLEIPFAYRHELDNLVCDYLRDLKAADKRFTNHVHSLRTALQRSPLIFTEKQLSTARFVAKKYGPEDSDNVTRLINNWLVL